MSGRKETGQKARKSSETQVANSNIEFLPCPGTLSYLYIYISSSSLLDVQAMCLEGLTKSLYVLEY